MLPELRNRLSERAVLVAKFLGDLHLRAAVEEHSPQRLVATVIRLGGPGKELPVRRVVHNGCSLGL
jgi:hypothetical protein